MAKPSKARDVLHDLLIASIAQHELLLRYVPPIPAERIDECERRTRDALKVVFAGSIRQSDPLRVASAIFVVVAQELHDFVDNLDAQDGVVEAAEVIARGAQRAKE
jgi:hypothetical protein